MCTSLKTFSAFLTSLLPQECVSRQQRWAHARAIVTSGPAHLMCVFEPTHAIQKHTPNHPHTRPHTHNDTNKHTNTHTDIHTYILFRFGHTVKYCTIYTLYNSTRTRYKIKLVFFTKKKEEEAEI